MGARGGRVRVRVTIERRARAGDGRVRACARRKPDDSLVTWGGLAFRRCGRAFSLPKGVAQDGNRTGDYSVVEPMLYSMYYRATTRNCVRNFLSI